MTMTEQRYSPFYCGTQWLYWEVANCGNCHKQGRFDADGFWEWNCELQRVLSEEGFWGDGTVPAEIARRIGYLGKEGSYGWACPELVAIEPAAEYQKKLWPPRRLLPLWKRVWNALALAWDIYTFPWKRASGEPFECVGMKTAWEVSWDICHDEKERVR